MKTFFIKNNLYLLTALGVAVLIFTVLNWSAMPVLQRMVSLFFCAVILHLWEEGRFPGGFTDLITKKLYRGINPWLLTATAEERGYSSPYWLSYKQAQQKGGNVKAGEKPKSRYRKSRRS
jgi:hypothetical protein